MAKKHTHGPWISVQTRSNFDGEKSEFIGFGFGFQFSPISKDEDKVGDGDTNIHLKPASLCIEIIFLSLLTYKKNEKLLNNFLSHIHLFEFNGHATSV
jgi:hypothetical protein